MKECNNEGMNNEGVKNESRTGAAVVYNYLINRFSLKR